MDSEVAWIAVGGVVALALVGLTLLALRSSQRLGREVRDLREELARVQSTTAPPAVEDKPAAEHEAAYLITEVGEESARRAAATPVVAEPIDGRLFVDIVARESAVKAASYLHGLRQALSPETRNRIGFAMKQQRRQSRRDRREEMREALRVYRARHRADTPVDGAADEDAA